MPKHRRSRTRGAVALLEQAAADYRQHQAARATGASQMGLVRARLAAQSAAEQRWGIDPAPYGADREENERQET